MENQTLYIVLGVIVVFLIIFLIPRGGSCNECYKPSGSAKFTVNRPKYVVPPVYPVAKNTIHRERYMAPPASQTPMLSAPIPSGAGFMSNTDNPFLGFPVGSISNGVSYPINPSMAPLLVPGNSEAVGTWKTVV
jgi:hypothetical protein